MSRSAKTMDLVRRAVDLAMIFASLMLVAWPFADHTDMVLLAGGVSLLGLGVAALSRRFPPAKYAPVAAALVLAGLHARTGGAGNALLWLVIVIAGTILTRQFLGSHTDEVLIGGLTRQRAIFAGQAFLDPLTQLGNRAMFMDRAEDALNSANDRMTAVILVDLDGFKGVNDTYGHLAGDELLRVTAERLNANVRGNDMVARLGGDEFVVLLPMLTDDQIADTVGNRILRDLRQPLIFQDAVLTISASAGIAITRGSGIDVDTLLREADSALYQAKDEGKGVARRFDPARFAELEQRRHDEQEVRRALAEQQFEVYYQPIVDLAGEHTVGAEALIRWRHPIRGVLPPAAFLDLAESLGMMPELGLWVLREACRQAVRWQADNPAFELNVNLSASQLGNPALIDEVREVLEETGISSQLLVLELTESVAVTDLAESARVLTALKTLGVRIALDDFGTGFSSLSHLGVLPVDVVKIDKSFVQAMQNSPVGGSVAEAVLQIARTFNLAPVAEGVEDADQASRLRELECAQAQGYHFAKPMPAGSLTELLTRQSLNAA
jgi:diguanylate cyclase (GGDEF)-like protein